VKAMCREGVIQLFYFDEAGFCASPPVQRAWSPIGKPHETMPAHHQKVAVLGALDFSNQRLYHSEYSGTINREIFVDFMDDLITNIAKPIPTLIILDNARIHHNIDESILSRWVIEHKTFLCYLPPYSPELNMIEIVWKQAKYHWREFVTWSKDSFQDKVKELLDGYGSKFQICFS